MERPANISRDTEQSRGYKSRTKTFILENRHWVTSSEQVLYFRAIFGIFDPFARDGLVYGLVSNSLVPVWKSQKIGRSYLGFQQHRHVSGMGK